MQPKFTSKRYETRTRKNAMSVINYSNLEDSNFVTFIKINAHKQFTNHFTGMSVHSKRGFVYDIEEEYLGLSGDIGQIIKVMR